VRTTLRRPPGIDGAFITVCLVATSLCTCLANAPAWAEEINFSLPQTSAPADVPRSAADSFLPTGSGFESSNLSAGGGFFGTPNTAGAAGSKKNETDLTSFRHYEHKPPAGNIFVSPGETRTTDSQGYLDPNNSQLPLVQTGLMAPGSVNPSPIPSGQFDLGFPEGSPQTYRGIYNRPSGPAGSTLPQTSTSSVDLNVESGGRAPH